MAERDSFDPWIDFLVTDQFAESPRSEGAADAAASSSADVRGDALESRPELELVYVRVARREPLRSLELPYPELPELPETEGRLRSRRKRRTIPDWLVGESEDTTCH